MSYLIRQLTDRTEALHAMHALSAAVNWNQPLVACEEIIATPGFEYYASFEDNVLAGAAGIISYGNQGYISMVTVAPEFQRRGHCTRLFEHIHRTHIYLSSFALNASPEGAPVYRNLGYHDVSQVQIIGTRTPDPSQLPSTDIVPLSLDDIPWLAHADRINFGHDRTRLIRHNLRLNPELAFRRTDHRAFILGRHYKDFTQMCMLEAETTQDALELLGTVVARHPEQPIYMFVPLQQTMFIQKLQNAGFGLAEISTDMATKKAAYVVSNHYFTTYGGDFG